jgi:hypothetical protein
LVWTGKNIATRARNVWSSEKPVKTNDRSALTCGKNARGYMLTGNETMSLVLG